MLKPDANYQNEENFDSPGKIDIDGTHSVIHGA